MNRFKIFVSVLLLFCIMSFFCYLTPLVFDDFGYGAGGSSLKEMFVAQIHEHLTWSGKFIGHFMARILLHGPSWIHPILSPLIFIGCIFSGVILTLGINWRDKIRSWQLILLAGLTWFALPAFGTVFFWRTATPDYGYSLFFATAFLIPYRFWIDKKDYRFAGCLLYFFVGILAGWSNENVGMLSILVASGAIIYRFRTLKRIPVWAIAGITGALSGWLLMMTAPANAIRLTRLGGIEKIPAFSAESFQRFLTFWGSQQIEIVPYALVSIACIWILHRQHRLTMANFLPGLLFFLMSQASLAAFVFSPSTPYRAMTATFFYQACSCFAFIVATDAKSTFSKVIYAAFCGIFMCSIIIEANTFIKAQPSIAQRNEAMENGTLTAESFNYPRTDKYFFPTYDIIEINAYPESKRYQMIPWDKATPVNVDGNSSVKALVISNMVYLDSLPHGEVHIAAITHRQTLASAIQYFLRFISPLEKTASSSEVAARYAIASTRVTSEGKAILHIPGGVKLEDLAYVGIRDGEKPLIWRRVYR